MCVCGGAVAGLDGWLPHAGAIPLAAILALAIAAAELVALLSLARLVGRVADDLEQGAPLAVAAVVR